MHENKEFYNTLSREAWLTDVSEINHNRLKNILHNRNLLSLLLSHFIFFHDLFILVFCLMILLIHMYGVQLLPSL